jgi:hypothetical protein
LNRSIPATLWLLALALLVPTFGCGSSTDDDDVGRDDDDSGSASDDDDDSGSAANDDDVGGDDDDSGTSKGFPWEGAIDPSVGPASERLVARLLSSTSAPQGFYEYAPAGYPGDNDWPLLISIHGAGENGDGEGELELLVNNGITKLLSQGDWPNERPFLVLMPQHPGEGRPSATEIQSFISWALGNYPVDPRYVYLTAFSMGAYGSWSYLREYQSSQIAAFVPIAGSGVSAWQEVGCDLAQVGIWGFHGDADSTVNVSGTEVPLDQLAGCPSPPAQEVKKTIYPGVGHNSWDRTYDGSEGHDIFEWMLQFTHE